MKRKPFVLNLLACLFLGLFVACSDDGPMPDGNEGNPPVLPPLPVPEDMSLMMNLQRASVSALDEHYFYFVQADAKDVQPGMERTCTYQLCRRERRTGHTEVLHKIRMATLCPFDNLYIRNGYLYYTVAKPYDTTGHMFHGAEFWRMDTRTLHLEELAYADTDWDYSIHYTADSIFCREDRFYYFSMDYNGQGNGERHEYVYEGYNLHFPFLEYGGRYYFKTEDPGTLEDVIVSARPDRQDLQVLYQVPADTYMRIENCFVYQERIHVLVRDYDYGEPTANHYTLISVRPDGSDARTLIDRASYKGECSFGLAGNKLFVCTVHGGLDPGAFTTTELSYIDLQTTQTHRVLTKQFYPMALNVLLEDQVVLYGISQPDGREETYVCDLQGNCTLY